MNTKDRIKNAKLIPAKTCHTTIKNGGISRSMVKAICLKVKQKGSRIETEAYL